MSRMLAVATVFSIYFGSVVHQDIGETTQLIVQAEPVSAVIPVKAVNKVTKVSYNVPLGQDLQDFISAKSEDARLEPDLVMAVIKTESNFRNIIANSDYGLMQINRCNHSKFDREFGGFDPMDTYQNVLAGIIILSECRDYWEERGLSGNELEIAMLSSYNKGIGGYSSYGVASDYVSKIYYNKGEIQRGKIEN